MSGAGVRNERVFGAIDTARGAGIRVIGLTSRDAARRPAAPPMTAP